MIDSLIIQEHNYVINKYMVKYKHYCVILLYNNYIIKMFILSSIYKIISSDNPNLFFLKWVLIIAITLLLVMLSKHMMKNKNKNKEGFTQNEPFVFKQNDSAFDSFYADIYDSLHDTKQRSQKELIKIIEMTEPSSENSTFLDVGSGTGYVVNELNMAGYEVYGIDKSKEMLKYAQISYPESEFVYGDVLDSMKFEKGTFTHILCTYFTIYSIDNKEQFFQNCYHWMKPNTYLVLHLVDTDNFTNIIPHKDTFNENKQIGSRRTVITEAMFSDYGYKCSCEIPKKNDSKSSLLKETFIDIETNNIRQNEFKLHMESMDTILNIANKNGFIEKGKVNINDENGDNNQFLYILERPL